MSTRTRIAALALVNWKGVFYERYLLDQHVTALEGANGAGKTTVMIAAYIALLPDLTRLRFTNVGETGASGGDRGIWGRLGEPGRPSYTVLDLRVADGSRYIAAVRLTRASEPTLEVTAMGIEGVPDHVPLSAIFLVRHEDSDVVPDLDEIKHNVKNVGGKVTVFRAVKDYFAELFERGISPLRLLSDDDRAKFNDMLRTSMTGGISRSLTTELRGFVLKEESGMSDTLGRMKANLEACRRTRIEVAETRVLEEELAGIFEAGQAMYLAYAGSLQVQAEAAHTTALADAAKRNDLAQHLREVAEAQSHTERQSVHLTKAAQAARNDQERILTQWERLKSAAGLRAKLGTLDEELAVLEHRAAGARAAHEAAQLERVASRQDREQAQAAYERAALGLAELQRGVDELHLRAAEHRRYRHSWAIANELLGREVPMDTASETLIAIRQQCLAMGAERAEIERLTMDGERRASNFERATGALAVLEAGLISMGVDTGPASDNLEARAHVALDQLRLLDLQYGARNELVERLSETLINVERQQQARLRAANLDLPSLRTAAALASRLEATEQDHKTGTAVARHTERRIDERRLQRTHLLAEQAQATQRLNLWRPWHEALLRCWPDATPTHAAITERWQQSRQTSADLLATQADLRAERAFRQQQVLRLGRVGGDADEQLIALRDELGGELLRERFEALPSDEASEMAAALGPMLDAIVVDDPMVAAQKLAQRKRIDQPVWLIGASHGQGFAHQRHSDAVVANWQGLVRIAPAPAPVADESGGQRGVPARHLEQATLTTRIAQIDAELDALVTALGTAHNATADLEMVLRHAQFLDEAAPEQRRAEIDNELSELAAASQQDEADLATLRERLHQQASAIDDLREVSRDAALLEPPDYSTRTAGLSEQIARCDRFAAHIGELALARSTLLQLIDALRDPPPDAETLRTATLRAEGLASAASKMLQAEHALRDAMALRHAAEWSNIDDVLNTQNQLVPTLQEQCNQARRQLQASDDHVLSADTRWDEATTFRQQAEGTLHGAVELRARLHAELQSLAVSRDMPSDPTAELAAIGVQLNEIDVALHDAVTQAATLTERHASMLQRQNDVIARHEQALAEAARATAAWQALAAQISADGLAFPTVSSNDPASLAAMAQSKRAVLIDRVSRATGAGDLLDLIRRDETNPVEAWHRTRQWLARRVPAQVADHTDPLRALVRLREQLTMLHARLVRQEGDLRGASEDVARGIDVQLRRAAGTIKRLNQQLDGIGFGSIGAIRVQMRRIEKMEQILRALRAGEAQELLFLPTMPIEEALDEIFRRYGGAGKSGGQRLLDYREYLELVVEIKRQANTEWEVASPSRLSTGEAIGVGAALMMVVLAEWERDANLLRARPAGGSLRFLFLDEANRLSRDNLGVLFDLCRTLEMQLLIAAPEVARAQGNTTYRLVRHIADDGREEVIVSGRRALSQAGIEVDLNVATPPDESESVSMSESEAVAVSVAVSESVSLLESVSESVSLPVSESVAVAVALPITVPVTDSDSDSDSDSVTVSLPESESESDSES